MASPPRCSATRNASETPWYGESSGVDDPVEPAEHEPAIRCPECNVDPEFGPDRPSPFASGTLWAMMGGIAAMFLVTLALVALTN